jgi:hypothetical protein
VLALASDGLGVQFSDLLFEVSDDVAFSSLALALKRDRFAYRVHLFFGKNSGGSGSGVSVGAGKVVVL